MKKLFFYPLILLSLGCSLNEPAPLAPVDEYISPLKGLPDTGRVRLDSPKIGQRSYYVSFKAEKPLSSGVVTFTYQPDTMVMAITDLHDNQWIVKQFYTRGSAKVKAGTSSLTDSVAIYRMRTNSDSIHFIRGNSSLILTPIGLGKPLALPIEAALDASENSDCLPLFEYSVAIWTAYTVNHEQFGKLFNYLVNYFDYTQMAGDGFGFTYVYNNSFGITRFAWVSYWDVDQAEGWDLIPN